MPAGRRARRAHPADRGRERSFSGALSVDFASLKVGLQAAAIYGGTAAPSVGLLEDNLFSVVLATTRSDDTAVTRGTQVFGFLAGNGASHAGLTYNIQTGSAASTHITGAAIFAAVGAGATAGADWSRFETAGLGQAMTAIPGSEPTVPLGAADASALLGGAITFEQ